jgi:hypothetical protein
MPLKPVLWTSPFGKGGWRGIFKRLSNPPISLDEKEDATRRVD